MNEQSPISRESVRAACGLDDVAAAQAAIDRYLGKAPGLAAIEFAAREAGAMAVRLKLSEFRLATVTSFTGELLEPFLQLAAFRDQRRLACANVAYDQWFDALSRKGVVDAFAPDVIFVLLHLEDVLPGLARRHVVDAGSMDDNITRFIAGLGEAITGLRKRSQAPVIVGNFIARERLAERYFDANVGVSRQGWIEALNRKLGELARSQPNVWVLDYAATVTDFGRDRWFDHLKADHVGAPLTPGASAVLAGEVMGYVDALLRPRHKVLVVDLDNTLWGGIVGEDGPDGIAVSGDYPGNAYRNFQDFLVNLRATGTALAIASKNNEADARQAFDLNPRMPLKWNDFAAHRVSWADKHEALREIAKELNLGLDALVFADDNAFECDFVREMLPEVTVVQLDGAPSRFPRKILEGARFYPVTMTAEDRIRADAYAAERKREMHRQKAGDAVSFLSQLQLELQYRAPHANELDRVVQLFNKTNQFNLTLKRYQHADVISMLGDARASIRVASLSDRYGDYGLIGLVVTRDTEGVGAEREVDSFLMSCRALGRNVEDALLAEVEADARKAGRRMLVGRHVVGPKNSMVRDFYAERGFRQLDDNGNFVRSLGDIPPYERPQHVSVVREA